MSSRKKVDLTPSGVIVVELKDVVPRRDPDLPNLYVAKTVSTIEQRFDYLKGGKAPEWVQDNIVRLRRDLSVPTRPIESSLARTLHRDTASALQSRGFTVNLATTIWRVYVIELDPAGVKDPGLGLLYVGQTSRTPEERFQQHITKALGTKSQRLHSSVVAKPGMRLRMDLAPKKPLFDKEAAELAEVEWAVHLRSLGYVVKGGH